jgi:hypothetical protein
MARTQLAKAAKDTIEYIQGHRNKVRTSLHFLRKVEDNTMRQVLRLKLLDGARQLMVDMRRQKQNNQMPRLENKFQHINTYSFMSKRV